MTRTIAALASIIAVGCGSVFHGSTQQISVNSTPSGATARATCNDGSAVEATTPGKLMLRRSAEGCSITLSKSGYESQSVALTRGKSASMVANVPAAIPSALGVGIAGLIVCKGNSSAAGGCFTAGALLGLLLPGYLDARTGAMYTQRPERVDITLRPVTKP